VSHLKNSQNVSRIVKIKAEKFEVASNMSWLIINISRQRGNSTRNLCRPAVRFPVRSRSRVIFVTRKGKV
jgi:hypothetical protein